MSLRACVKYLTFSNRSLFSVDRKLLNATSPLSRNLFYYSTKSDGEQEKDAPENVSAKEEPVNPEAAPEEAPGETEKKVDKEKEFNEAKDAYLRCLAEMENIRIRARQEITDTTEKTFLRFANEILPIADILNESLGKVPEESRTEGDSQLSNLCTGVTMIRTELSKTLRRHGVEEYAEVNVEFNPVLHEVAPQSKVSGKVSGVIAEVVKPGYMYKNRVLRPATVIVAEKTEKQE
ncbi:GrpE-domain-containing protein [Basidiobolus meristosporus CBS 931.73]|uniref:GrpE protein homolog, mitochondrial n=1 Tax=Basidiobolus meristosporus CBS 931.73 TaxID=1314790 RepID=A0A1Y1YEL5_9FUNG|nr:GrpE-domain-containing protein [Basidiobolus meristosporus CBS 931.73]|eukprot:ORX96408.1 GrpE-domain-containing protein [Basidiobolus meristosporus CBS 931.73]